MHERLRLLVSSVLALSSVACAAFPGHPVRLSAPRIQGVRPGAAGEIPEPRAPTDEEVEAALFLGLEGPPKPPAA